MRVQPVVVKSECQDKAVQMKVTLVETGKSTAKVARRSPRHQAEKASAVARSFPDNDDFARIDIGARDESSTLEP
jgi:hypothetical protein